MKLTRFFLALLAMAVLLPSAPLRAEPTNTKSSGWLAWGAVGVAFFAGCLAGWQAYDYKRGLQRQEKRDEKRKSSFNNFVLANQAHAFQRKAIFDLRAKNSALSPEQLRRELTEELARREGGSVKDCRSHLPGCIKKGLFSEGFFHTTEVSTPCIRCDMRGYYVDRPNRKINWPCFTQP